MAYFFNGVIFYLGGILLIRKSPFAVKIQKFLQIRIPIPENHPSTKNQPIWRTCLKFDFLPSSTKDEKLKKFSDYDDFGVKRLLSSSPTTFAIALTFKLIVSEIIRIHKQTSITRLM